MKNIITITSLAAACTVGAQTFEEADSFSQVISGSNGRIASIDGGVNMQYQSFAGGEANLKRLIDGAAGGDANNVNWMQASTTATALPHRFRLSLAGPYNINQVRLWNDHGATGGHGVNEVTFTFSSDGTILGTETFNVADSVNSTFAERQEFVVNYLNVDRVDFTVNSVHGVTGPNTYQLGEVQFRGSLAPEPSSTALLGLGALGLLARRKR